MLEGYSVRAFTGHSPLMQSLLLPPMDTDHVLVIVAKPAEMPVESGGREAALLELDEPVRGVDPVRFQQLQNPNGR